MFPVRHNVRELLFSNSFASRRSRLHDDAPHLVVGAEDVRTARGGDLPAGRAIPPAYSPPLRGVWLSDGARARPGDRASRPKGSCGADATVCRLDQLPGRRREGGCGSATPQTALSGPMTRRAVGLPDSPDSGLGLAPPGLATSMGLGAAVRTKKSGGDGGIEQYIMARARSL